MTDLIPMREVEQLVGRSASTIDRAQDFPKAVRLGDSPRGKRLFVRSEVIDWMQNRVANRASK